MERVERLHYMARLFMAQFENLETLSLDDFLMEHKSKLTAEQLEFGYIILDEFEYEE
jgi:hypothetical protein